MRILAAATAGLRRFLDVLLIALVIAVLAGILLAKLVPLTGRQTIIVGGASMEPAIGLGAAIVIRPVPAEELAVGDVVTMHAGEKNAIYTHRIIEVVDRPDGRWIRTQGDANASPDPTLIHESAVVGRTELAIPFIGYLLALLSLPTGVLFLVGIAATLLAAAWLLESLELERATRVTVTLVPGTDRGLGEPIALRPVAPRDVPADGGFLAGAKLTRAEQLAFTRATRAIREHRSSSIRSASRQTTRRSG
jgi:signal peptidase I